MMVKICGITNLDDALAAVEGGASALGFNFYSRSPRYITPGDAARIVERLPAGTINVGVFVNHPADTVLETTRIARLDVAQLHGDEPPSAIPAATRVWKAFRVDERFSSGRMEGYDVEAFLLDAPSESLYGGTGRSFDWALARGTGRRIILAGGLDAVNVRAAIEVAHPWGVDACSKIESAPGRKDHQKMREFLKAALA